VAAAGREEVAAAVRGAASAFPAWRDTLPLERGRILLRIAEGIAAEADRLAELESRDNGKPLQQALADVAVAARYFEFYGAAADKLHGDSLPLGDGVLAYTRREPFGVVGAIVPWNLPLNQAARCLAPALAVGNTVVLKPAEDTSVSSLALAELAHRHGLPAHVLNVVPGLGTVAGAALVEHPLVRKVAFTGSVETGRAVAQAAGGRLVPTTLELGGKSAHIVFADADLDQAARHAVKAILLNSGQVCSAGSRLLVEESVHDELVSRLQALFQATADGSAELELGPLTTLEQKKKVERYIELAAEEGAEVWRPRTDAREGWFVPPAILTKVSNDMTVAQDEIFGPVLCVIPFRDEAAAVRIANDSRFGLVAGVCTNDVSRAHRVAAALEVGQVFVNEYFLGGVETPFGGVKESGYGREKGIAGALEYTSLKTVIVRVDALPAQR
jgi:aldehyde dehydrogenase (NAD+)